jgi:hypothetical protein
MARTPFKLKSGNSPLYKDLSAKDVAATLVNPALGIGSYVFKHLKKRKKNIDIKEEKESSVNPKLHTSEAVTTRVNKPVKHEAIGKGHSDAELLKFFPGQGYEKKVTKFKKIEKKKNIVESFFDFISSKKSK